MRNLERPGRSVVYAPNAMAATSHSLASQTAIEILKAGGNAMDAAIAACAVQCVVEPGSTGLGGDNFCLYAPEGAADKIIAFNGSGRAPSGATCAYYAAQGITEIPRQSPHAVVVPGAVDAWFQLHRDHGRMPMPALLAPAIAYARNGYPISPRVQFDWRNASDLMQAEPTMARIFLPGGRVPEIGDMHCQPELAATLEAIATEGPDIFYKGEIATDMVTYLRSLGGLHTPEDFAAAKGNYVSPITGNFRQQSVYQCPPNGQGVIALLLLNIASEFAKNGGPITTERIHAEIEACRLAYCARNLYLADPDQAPVDVDALLDPAYAARLRGAIDPDRAADPRPSPDVVRHEDTVYICVIDKDRNVCSFINTLFHGWGAGLCAPQSGVVFTNRAQGFSLDPASPNAIAPGKRPLHTIIPGMLAREGRVVMAYGVMGGEYQAMGHMQFLTRHFDFGLDIQEAMDAPRFMADPFTGEVEIESAIPAEICQELAAKGHRIVAPKSPIGGSQAIAIDWEKGVLHGASDPRKDGCALGY